jgi:hypothetical protein
MIEDNVGRGPAASSAAQASIGWDCCWTSSMARTRSGRDTAMDP